MATCGGPEPALGSVKMIPEEDGSTAEPSVKELVLEEILPAPGAPPVGGPPLGAPDEVLTLPAPDGGFAPRLALDDAAFKLDSACGTFGDAEVDGEVTNVDSP